MQANSQEEQLDILDKFANKTGASKGRTQIHIDGDWHSSVHLWFIDATKGILLQKRSQTKKLYPGMLVAPVSGHIDSGSSPIESLIKEAREEMNLELTTDDFFLQAILRGTYADPGIGLKEREYINIFIYEGDFSKLNTETHNDEVEAFIWLPYRQFFDLVKNHDNSLVPAFEEYEIILAYIDNAQPKIFPSDPK